MGSVIKIKQSHETYIEADPKLYAGHALFAFLQVLYYILAVTPKMNELWDYAFQYPYRLAKINAR